MRRSSKSVPVALVVLLALLALLPASSAAPAAGVTWSPSSVWSWVERAMPRASGPDQFAQAVISGTSTAGRNGAFVLRRTSAAEKVVVSFSGTRYQVRAYAGGQEKLLVDRPFAPAAAAVARVELRGSTVTTSWAGQQIASDTLPALAQHDGTGTALSVWQDTRSAVKLSAASSGTLAPEPVAPAPEVDPTPTDAPTPSPAPTAPGSDEGVTWSTPTTWQWVRQPMPATSGSDQFAEAAITGTTTAGTNGGFVLRRSTSGDHVLVSFSGTRYQVRTFVAGGETLLVDEPYAPPGLGAARVELRGSTVTTSWGGVPVASHTHAAIGRLTGTGTGLAVWQEAASAVTVAHAVTGDLAPLPPDTPAVPAHWVSGASGNGVVDGSLGTWRGRPVEIAGTWNDNFESHRDQWSVRPGFEFASWQGDLDVAVGGIYKDRGETWDAAAAGAYDTRWREALTNLDKGWGSRPGTLYVRFAHEFNGDWYPWAVTGPEAQSFVAAWKRFRAIQVEVAPRFKLVFCPNVETSSSLGLDWRTAFPGAAHVDVVSVDSYNQYPFVRTADEFDAVATRRDGKGAPAGIESHRQYAAQVGRPFAVSEWGGNADLGDSPVFMTEMHRWLSRHGGTGPGQVVYEIYFNVGSFGSGQFQLHPVTRQPLSRTEYARLW